MEPRYVDKQIVWVQPCEELREGEIGVFYYDGAAYIKQYHVDRSAGGDYPHVVYHSLNPAYPDVPIGEGAYRLFGRVLN